MPATKLKLNLAGFRKLRKLPEVDALVRREAEDLAKRCGPGYKAERSPSANRSRWTVFPDTPEAIADNAKHNTILRNMR